MINKVKHLYCVGIGGIGVSAIAKLFLAYGKKVSGSDVHKSSITTALGKRGINVSYDQNSDLPQDVDLLIYSPAVPEDNPQRKIASKRQINQLSYPEFLGELSRQYHTIAVSGTNGKSTTTAMIGKIFEAANLDPTIIVGTQVPGFDGNLRIGKSDYLIVEACEWQAHMLNLAPTSIVLTNLMMDHTDFYKSVEDLKHYFQKFIDSLPANKGLLAYNADDGNLTSLTKEKGFKISSWGIENKTAEINGTDVKLKEMHQLFKIKETEYSLKIPGYYNIYNALAAITLAKQYQINDEVIKQALAEFTGSWRRFEVVGRLKEKDTLVISDYAHHPEALKGVIKAAREFYPEKRLLVVFQPHHYDRTHKLFDGFVKSFTDADLTIINQIYDVAGREKHGERKLDSQDLAEAVQKFSPSKEIIFSPDLKKTEQLILTKAEDNDIILIVGAGDIDDVARKIVN